MIVTNCTYRGCDQPIGEYKPFCYEHYLKREAQFGISDLANEDKYWNHEYPEDVIRLRKRAINAVVFYAKYMMEKSDAELKDKNL